MRNTQSILYKIGKIVNYVLMGIHGLWLIIDTIYLIRELVNGWAFAGTLVSLIFELAFLAIVFVLAFYLVPKYEEDAKKAPTDALTPVIILMIFGLLCWNVLYTVGGVFGIIAASQEKNGQAEQPKEEPKEEKKEEESK